MDGKNLLWIILGFIAIFLWKWYGLISIAVFTLLLVILKNKNKNKYLKEYVQLQLAIVSLTLFATAFMIVQYYSLLDEYIISQYIQSLVIDSVLVILLVLLFYSFTNKILAITLGVYQIFSISTHSLTIIGGSERILGQSFMILIKAYFIYLIYKSYKSFQIK